MGSIKSLWVKEEGIGVNPLGHPQASEGAFRTTLLLPTQ